MMNQIGAVGDVASDTADVAAKAALAAAAEKGCEAAAVAYGNPELAPLCGPLAAVAVKFVYPLVKGLLLGGFQVFADALSGLFTHVNFNPDEAIYEWWAGGSGDIILKHWEAATNSVLIAWHQGLASAGLPDRPYSFNQIILPQAAFKPGMHPGAVGDPLVTSYAERVQAQNLLYFILYSMPLSTSTGECGVVNCRTEGFDGHGTPSWSQPLHVAYINDPDVNGDADVWSPAALGLVEEAVGRKVNGQYVITAPAGFGPFSIIETGFPVVDCNQQCNEMFGHAVSLIWASRLDALRLAIPIAVSKINYSIASSIHSRKAKSTRNARLVVGAVALAGIGAATWPFWGKYALGLGSKIWQLPSSLRRNPSKTKTTNRTRECMRCDTAIPTGARIVRVGAHGSSVEMPNDPRNIAARSARSPWDDEDVDKFEIQRVASEWHGGQWSSLYAVSLSLYAGNEAALTKADVGGAAREINHMFVGGHLSKNDRAELENAVDGLNAVYDLMPDDGSE